MLTADAVREHFDALCRTAIHRGQAPGGSDPVEPDATWDGVITVKDAAAFVDWILARLSEGTE